jgi:hypothetical protein
LIVKPRNVPLIMQKIQTLFHRLPEQHPNRPEIEREYSWRKAGLKGEREIDYYISLLPEEDYLVFAGLRLPYGSKHFQIDTLLLSSQYALLIEIKNLAGELFYNQHTKQLIKTHNGKEEAFSDPIAQVMRQKYQFKRLLENSLPNSFPLEHLVVLSNQSSILKTNPGGESIFKEIMFGESLIFRISEMQNSHKKQLLTTTQLKKVKDNLLKWHQPFNQDILEQYSIMRKEVYTGVRCPSCNYLPMEWKRGVWVCAKCRHLSKTAHINSIQDYVLLYNEPFKNSQIREFLHIPSIYLTSRFLSKADLRSNGQKRHRTYHLELND